jgi:hypothetical protein
VFPGDKGGRCVRLTTLPPSCAVVMKSENLNFLEPSGPLQACNETAKCINFFGKHTGLGCNCLIPGPMHLSSSRSGHADAFDGIET